VDLACLARSRAAKPGAACKARQRPGQAGSAAFVGFDLFHAARVTSGEMENGMSGFHQNCHCPLATTQAPSTPLVTAWAITAVHSLPVWRYSSA